MGQFMGDAKLKSDYRQIQRQVGDTRTAESLMAHYELERRLADRLRGSSRDERAWLYTDVYSELFASLPDHPQNTPTAGPRSERIAKEVRLLRPLLTPDSVYLELGCGDAALPFALAGLVGRAIALDITDVLVDFASAPPNFEFLKTPGIEIALPDNSVDVVYSNQLMEHLHVDDVAGQLREIIRVLKPGGKYLCITPSRVTGPHDVSIFFDETATGFHLREYDYGSIREIFLDAGFNRVSFLVVVGGRRLATPPYAALRALERALLLAPKRYWRSVSRLLTPLMGITAVGAK
jgi:SAM-dependent methyltransferase